MSIQENAQNALNSISLSRYALSILVPSLIVLMHRSRYSKWILAVAFSVSFILLFLAAQRGSIIGLGLGLLIYFVFNKEGLTARSYLPHLFFLGSITAFLFLTNQFDLASRFNNLDKYQEFDRFADYGRSWDIFRGNSFFYPEGSYGYEFLTGRVYPHNFFLESMVEYGGVGLFLAIGIFFLGINYSFKIIRSRVCYFEKAIPVIWIALGFSALVSTDVLGNRLFLIVTALLALSYELDVKKQHFRVSKVKYHHIKG